LLNRPALTASSIPFFSLESSYSVEAGHDCGGIEVLVAGIPTIWMTAIWNGGAVKLLSEIFSFLAKKYLDMSFCVYYHRFRLGEKHNPATIFW